MKKFNLIFISLIAMQVLAFSQRTYTKSVDWTFTGSSGTGGWENRSAYGLVWTINTMDGIMNVVVNKTDPWLAVLHHYDANCFAGSCLIFDQNNRYAEFRVKSNTATTGNYFYPTWGSCDACCPQTKTWPTSLTFSFTEVDTWTIFFIQIPATTGGTQNVIDTVPSGLTFDFKNGTYDVDYIKVGTAAIPPIPVIDVVKPKTVYDHAGVQNVTLTGIAIPNRLIDGLTITAESLSDGIIQDVTILDLGSGPFAVDEATNIATAALQFTPVDGMAGLGDSIIITLHDNIRGTMRKTSFYVNLIDESGGCTATVPSASNVTICSGNTATLTATGGINYRWYNASTGGTLLGSNASYITPALTSTTTYYVANDNGTCESARQNVDAIISSSISPKITAMANTHFLCNSAPELLTATPSGGTFSGDGVELGYFVPALAKINHINSIYYNYGGVGCSGKDSLHIYVYPCIKLGDDVENEIKIFPNPTNGVFAIEINEVKNDLSIQLFDALGITVFEDQKSGIEVYFNNIDLSSYPAGIYLLKAMTNNQIILKRIIKK
jgi:hypothetical protein